MMGELGIFPSPRAFIQGERYNWQLAPRFTPPSHRVTYFFIFSRLFLHISRHFFIFPTCSFIFSAYSFIFFTYSHIFLRMCHIFSRKGRPGKVFKIFQVLICRMGWGEGKNLDSRGGGVRMMEHFPKCDVIRVGLGVVQNFEICVWCKPGARHEICQNRHFACT